MNSTSNMLYAFCPSALHKTIAWVQLTACHFRGNNGFFLWGLLPLTSNTQIAASPANRLRVLHDGSHNFAARSLRP
jgi:hypothetical protein